MASAAQLTQLNAATVALFAPGLNSGSYVSRAHAFIAALVSTDLSGYGSLDNTTGRLDARFDHHPVELQSCLEGYGRHMHKYEPFRFDPGVNGGKPYSARDFFTRPQFHDLDIFQEVHQPLGCEDHCFVHVPTEPGTTVFFGLFRQGIFRTADKKLLELAQPHLANARRLATAHSELRDPNLDPEVFTRFGFSHRESEILALMIDGLANAEISHALRLRTDTVSAYIRNIYVKMRVSNRVSAVIYALTLSRSVVSSPMKGAFQVNTGRLLS